MTKRLTLLIYALILTTLSLTVHAQEAAKSVYFELGGPGIASVNYDMRFQKKEDGLGFRAGIGGFSIRYNNFDGTYDRSSILTIPLGLNYLLGKDQRHYFELGAGATIVTANNRNNGFQDETFNSTFGHLTFGYRLQPKNGGFTFRAAINPIFGKGFFVPYYAGVSFGYKF